MGPAPPPALPPAERPNVALASAIASHFVCAIGCSAFALVPKYLMVARGFSQAEVGPVAMGIPLGSVLCSPLVLLLMGRLALRHLVRGCALLFAAVALVFAHWPYPDGIGLWTFLAGAAAMGIFNGGSAMVAAIAPAHAMARFIGLHGAAGMLGYGLGPLLFERISAAWGWTAAFGLAGAVSLASCLLPLPRDGARPPDASRTRNAFAALRPLLVVSLLVGVMHNALWTWHQPLVLARGGDEVYAYFMGMSGGALFMRVLFGGLPDRIGAGRAALGSAFLYVIATLAMTWVTPATLGLFGFVHGVAHGVFYPAIASFCVSRVSASARSRALAALYATFSAGSTAASFSFAQLGEAWGPDAVFPVAACVGAVAWLVLSRETRLAMLPQRAGI